MTGAFSRNIGKLFSELKLVPDYLLFILCSSCSESHLVVSTLIPSHAHTHTHTHTQVVQTMFEMMDATKEAYEQVEEQKNELEELWKTEKDKRKSAQQVGLAGGATYS